MAAAQYRPKQESAAVAVPLQYPTCALDDGQLVRNVKCTYLQQREEWTTELYVKGTNILKYTK
jgi:hypothetical protein